MLSHNGDANKAFAFGITCSQNMKRKKRKFDYSIRLPLLLCACIYYWSWAYIALCPYGINFNLVSSQFYAHESDRTK